MCDIPDVRATFLIYMWHKPFTHTHLSYTHTHTPIIHSHTHTYHTLTHTHLSYTHTHTPIIHTHGLRWSETMYTWHASFMCDMPHASFMCDMPHSCVNWLSICDINHSNTHTYTYTHTACDDRNERYMWHGAFTCDMPHSCVHIKLTMRKCMGWLRLVGSLFCKRALQKRKYSVKETYNFKEPTTCSHPITRTHTPRWCGYHLYVKWSVHM